MIEVMIFWVLLFFKFMDSKNIRLFYKVAYILTLKVDLSYSAQSPLMWNKLLWQNYWKGQHWDSPLTSQEARAGPLHLERLSAPRPQAPGKPLRHPHPSCSALLARCPFCILQALGGWWCFLILLWPPQPGLSTKHCHQLISVQWNKVFRLYWQLVTSADQGPTSYKNLYFQTDFTKS